MPRNPFSRAFSTARLRVLVVSAKGGVGKSTVSVMLAAALTQRGLRVGIFDADLHGPNIPALLGVRQNRDLSAERNADALFAIEARPDGLDGRPLTAFERYGIGIMSLGLLAGSRQAITPPPGTEGPLLRSLLDRVDWGKADVLLIDMPPGTGEPLRDFMAAGLADAALVVTTRESLAHLDNGRLLAVLRRARLPVLGIIENMTHVICPACGELIALYPLPAAAEAVYDGMRMLPSLPFHPALIRAPGMPPLPLREPVEADRAAHDACLHLADAVREALLGVRPVSTPPPDEDDCIDC